MDQKAAKAVRVILADDHRMVREGLRLVLGRHAHIVVVAEAGSGTETVDLARRHVPNIVIMDVAMPDLNGVEATRIIRQHNDAIRIIGLSAHVDRRYVVGMLDAGASGYIQKSAAGEELVRAIDAVEKGRRYLSGDIAQDLMDSYVNRAASGGVSTLRSLSEREMEILRLLAKGHVAKEIASSLHISFRTVETHRRNIMRKLDLHNIAELTRHAIREGLISLEH
jgi:two-component system, NarL family, response regulator NreC